MTDKEYILAQLPMLSDRQCSLLVLALKVLNGTAPNTRDARISAAMVYRTQGMSVIQIARKLYVDERTVYRYLKEARR